MLFWFLIFVASVLLAFTFYDRFWGIPKLSKDNRRPRTENRRTKTSKSYCLKTQLAPFKTIALERYPGAVTDALARLGNDLETLQKQLNDEKTSIKDLQAARFNQTICSLEGRSAAESITNVNDRRL